MPWTSESLRGEVGGLVKNYENFTFMKVSGAGHMVPMDQPEIAYDMIMTFIRDKKLHGSPKVSASEELKQERESDDEEDYL